MTGENKVTIEKEGLLGIAIFLISAGAGVMVQDPSPYGLLRGIIIVLVGVGIIVLRGHLKFHRWAHVPNNWRGKDHNGVDEDEQVSQPRRDEKSEKEEKKIEKGEDEKETEEKVEKEAEESPEDRPEDTEKKIKMADEMVNDILKDLEDKP
ncbi:MAG: hypothetical protein ACE5IJ_12050 [Thermoplasmata archaeon]